MVFKTLHGYILRELLRIFLMTASALTTLLAFGGTFRSFTKQGIDILQLMAIIMNLMPAMLAYAIPISALFAAVLVYWRMSTDNELTACRASGISFPVIVVPALILGLVVASTDLVFVNYVVPVFLERTERVITSDLGSLLVSQVGRQENFKFDRWVIYADSAELREPEDHDPNVSIVVLKGMAATFVKENKPSQIAVADEAVCTITDLPDEGSAKIGVRLTNGSLFNAKTFQKVSGSVENLSQIDGRSLVIPSFVKSKPKFLNLKQLFILDKNPTKFPPVADVVDRIRTAYVVGDASRQLFGQWSASPAVPQVYVETSLNGGAAAKYLVHAPRAQLDPDNVLVYYGAPGNPVVIERQVNGRTESSYRCDSAEVQISLDEVSTTPILSASLQLHSQDVFSQDVPQYGRLVLTAQSATQVESNDPQVSRISLKAVMATVVRDGKVVQSAFAPDATMAVSNIAADGSAQVSLQAKDVFAIDAGTMQILPGRTEGAAVFNAPAFVVPGMLRGKARPFTSRQIFVTSQVTRSNTLHNITNIPAGTPLLPGLQAPVPAVSPESLEPIFLRNAAHESTSPVMHGLSENLESQIKKLFQTITSELHSRGSFSLSCLTLVLLGAALGILMRGKNPLAVFVVGFMPAAFLVLLITAGRQLAEGSPKNVHTGIALIWAGNVLLLAIVVGVYTKLLRH